MADKRRADEEPSIEEILDSIRQIISEDEKSAAAPPEDELEDDFTNFEDINALEEDILPEEEDDVFELMDRVEPEAVFEAEPAPIPEPEPIPVAKIEEPAFVVDLIDETQEDVPPVVQPPAPVPDPVVEKIVTEKLSEPKPSSVNEGDSILTRAAENAAVAAIAELARRTAVEHSGITIEEIVRSELKPLLRGWLDKNLPIVIERLVREELERVTKRVLED